MAEYLMGKKANNADKQRSIVNRKARPRYDIVERLEAGVALLGTEVKAIRDGQVDLSAGFARMENNQVILHEVHIKPCLYGNVYNHEPRRPRRLLLHRREIHKLLGALNQKGRTLIPLAMYFNRHGKLTVEL